MHTHVDGCALTCLDDLFLKLLAHLCHHLFDTCRVDTTVEHELMQCQTGSLATHWVEAREDDGFRSIVNHDLDTCCRLESTDVSTLTADDATLHLIAVDMENGHCVLNRSLACYALYGLDDNRLCLLVGGHPCLIHYLVDIRSSLALCLILETLNELALCLIGR